MKISELSADERPRQRMVASGPSALSKSELVAVLLRTGTREESALELSQRLLREAGGSLVRLSEMSYLMLCSISGIKEQKATAIMAAMELGRRFMSEKSDTAGKPVTGSRGIYEMMRPLLKGLLHEESWIVFLNSRNVMTGRMKVTTGGFDATIFDAGQICKAALEYRAAGVVLVHNHPSGDPRPSVADINQTEKLHTRLAAIDLALMDHVIVADDSYYSFSDGAVGEG